MNSLAPGSLIGSYRVVRTLSEAGHFSLVYCAQSRGGGEIALKENFPVGAAYRSRDGATLRVRDREIFAWALARFEREAEFLRRHRHVNLVRVLEPPIRQNGTSYMAMEYLTGGSLRRRIEQGGAQGEAQVRAWLDSVLAALQSIESVGTSHLDLSPDNVMFRGSGEPVLVDFGSARIGGMAPTQRTRMITNSGYSAPEKLTRTSRDIDARADVYSVAALVNFAMTGREPSPAQDRMVGVSALPARLAARRQGGPRSLPPSTRASPSPSPTATATPRRSAERLPNARTMVLPRRRRSRPLRRLMTTRTEGGGAPASSSSSSPCFASCPSSHSWSDRRRFVSSSPSARFLPGPGIPPASGAIVGGRDEQQDEARIEPFEADGVPALLLVVADGMGGHAGGRVASRVAVDAFAGSFHAHSSLPLRARLRGALEAANGAVGDRMATSRELSGMGCTIVAAVLAGNYLRWISVGDSLLLAIKDRQLVRLNADHSFAPELDRAVREGRMSQAEADRDPDRHVLRSAVTGGSLSMVDEGARRLGEGALVLLATDGILTLPLDRIALAGSAGETPERTVAELLAAVSAARRPDQDNTTLVAAYCEGGEGAPSRRRRRQRRALGLVALSIAVLAGMLAAYVLIESGSEGDEAAARRPPVAAPKQSVPPAPSRTPGDFDGSIFKSPPASARERRNPERAARPKAAQAPVKPPAPASGPPGVVGNADEPRPSAPRLASPLPDPDPAPKEADRPRPKAGRDDDRPPRPRTPPEP